ncbi:radical SAM protein [Fulvivirga sp. 29W222]|uniref:Radical SAM protein n=1 Tax=Fulvivirga marina TaxID=2494733 RepID=A0A937G179_9BACT|nr:radical SAM protein [Fulvivirga marina]MBL6448618.1 radical SAM protein [Fulvivirga marina]
MALEVRPFGVKCNIACQYCYQNMHRDAGNGGSQYHPELVKQRILEDGEPFHLFGGEPLLMSMTALEDLLQWGHQQFGETSVMTNGALINEAHIELFLRYNTKVGISIDGPEELNDVRWAGTIDKTRQATKRSIKAIHQLRQAKIPIGLQIQVTRSNSSPDRLPKMFEWLREMDALEIASARLHVLEIDHPAIRKIYSFSAEENITVFSAYKKFEKTLKHLRFDIFRDVHQMLLAEDEHGTCTWRACDPYSTEAVNGIDGEGNLHNCGLTDKEGINFQQPANMGYERYIALYHTPDEYGGCRNCRFFLSCKGQCPGTAIDGEWRNKSENCGLWKYLFEEAEQEMLNEGLSPVSLHPQRKQIEEKLINHWANGQNPTLQYLIQNFT